MQEEAVKIVDMNQRQFVELLRIVSKYKGIHPDEEVYDVAEEIIEMIKDGL
jgi:hypothetical protein